jgi:four helix bundle protein
MILDHERLDVYHLSLDFLVFGKHSKPDKRRYYLTARGSATESAALLDVYARLKLLDDAGHKAGKEMLVRVVSMLIKLAQSLEA